MYIINLQSVLIIHTYFYIPVSNKACFAWEYDANCAAFTTIARPIVGMAPRHNVKRPSSLIIRNNASNTFL